MDAYRAGVCDTCQQVLLSRQHVLLPRGSDAPAIACAPRLGPLASRPLLWPRVLVSQMAESMRQQSGMHGEATVEEMRRMFAETSPWLLALTGLVSCLHTVFDILAFKNDISFWKDNKSMKGLSFRAMLLNLFFQVHAHPLLHCLPISYLPTFLPPTSLLPTSYLLPPTLPPYLLSPYLPDPSGLRCA